MADFETDCSVQSSFIPLVWVPIRKCQDKSQTLRAMQTSWKWAMCAQWEQRWVESWEGVLSKRFKEAEALTKVDHNWTREWNVDYLIAEKRHFNSSSELFCFGETGVPSLLHHTLPLPSPQQLATAESQSRALPLHKHCGGVSMGAGILVLSLDKCMAGTSPP